MTNQNGKPGKSVCSEEGRDNAPSAQCRQCCALLEMGSKMLI